MTKMYVNEGKSFWLFPNVTDAYRCYLRHYVTNADRMYYWRCAHTRLSDVKDEEVMKAIFRNVFSKAFIKEV